MDPATGRPRLLQPFVVVGSFPTAFLYQDVFALADDRQNGPDDLDSRISRAKAEQSRGVTDAAGRSETRGWAIGIEFVGTVLVGAFIGYLLDTWLNTTPWLMLVLLVLGFAAGTMRAMKTSNQFDADPSNDGR